ncbi:MULTISPECIES: hypothetical protein [Cryobacterium]|uniref:Uncharacterized protein n=1 Tax=Cryobacterium breve TaxID=1259258 RepID=A0ABY2IUB4_9MICO|nr:MULTISPECIES: hypothetical protein [Cryobacterium]TFC94449.1 hypothetical protein E3T20_08085 [Cryobacterium sp. TmT3-12]TFC95053.1 hypothetical protein E3O65_15975 [Cryobacterium breve]
MTLTAIMPTLRRTLPDPFNVNAWPEGSQVTTTDVIISGVSMNRLVEICQTPCVHTAAAVIPGTYGRPSSYQGAAVVVVRVTTVLRNCGAARVVLIDACLDTVNAAWPETRLLGRASTVKSTVAVLLSGESHETSSGGRGVVELPDDLREGDLLAIPCAGAVALRDVRARPPVRINAPNHGQQDTAEFTWLAQLA